MTPKTLYLEFGRASVRLFDGTEGVELALERSENGRLTSGCKATLLSTIGEFSRSRTGRGPMTALSAVGAQGVTMRKIRLPKCSLEELEGVLLLQIESEFPLPPDQLAWGYLDVPPQDSVISSNPGGPEVLVFALKADSLEDYAEILISAGITPSFTLAPFARRAIIPASARRNFSILHLAEPQCELSCFEQGALTLVRLISLGPEFQNPGGGVGSPANSLETTTPGFAAILAKALPRTSLGEVLYLTSDRLDLKALEDLVARALGGGIRCEVLDQAQAPGRSDVTLGLARAAAQLGSPQLPLFRIKTARALPSSTYPIPWKWIARAAALLICALGLRYLEPALSKAQVSNKLAEMKIHRATLPGFERELGFLQHLAKNQALIQDTIYVIANAAPQGTRIESLTISRRGEVSLRTSVAPPPQAVAFRSKLTDSGFFSTVVVEEQSQSPDRQKTTLRISALPKSGAPRPTIPTASASGFAKDAKVQKPKPTSGASSVPEKAASSTNAAPPSVGASKTNI